MAALGLLAVAAAGLGCSDDDDDGGTTVTGDVDAGDKPGPDPVPVKPVNPETLAKLKAASWPMMGYDAANNYHNPDEDTLSVDNAADLEVKWSFTVEGWPAGTPVIAEGKVFVMATGGTYAIDFATGEQVWKSSLGGTASVAYHDGAVYVHTAMADLYRLDAETGEQVWGPVKTFDWLRADGTSSPIVAHGKVYAGHSTILEVMMTEGNHQAEARGGVRALNIEDGSDAWHYYTTELPENGAMVWSSVAADEDAVYASTGNNYTVLGGNSDAIHAISHMDGSRMWVSQVRDTDAWVLTDPMLRGNPDSDFGANPILGEVDGKRVVAAGDKLGDFWMMDRENGDVVWKREAISTSHTPQNGGILNNGAFDGKVFYAVANQPPNESVLVAMKADEDGMDVWEPKVYGQVAWGMPSVANGVLVVPINDELHILNAETGEELKMFNVGGTVAAGSAAIAGGRIVVQSGMQYPFAPTAKNNDQVICYGLP